MKIKIFQKGFNYSQDGTGNRLVYHLQGCNMHCPWCSNPEGMSTEGTLIVNEEYLLEEICPSGAVKDKQISRKLCSVCKEQICIKQHKTKGIRLSCESYELDEIVEEARRSRPLFYDGGGVTLSGGEVTLQFDAVNMLLQKLNAEGIHTAIETNGSHPELETLFPFIDLLIIDFKHYDESRHKQITGISNHIIKENIKKVLAHRPDCIIRIPLIGGFNSLKTDAACFADFFRAYAGENVRFEFLPYHEYGKSKWVQCGMTYTMQNAYINQEAVFEYEKIFKENNLTVIHT